MRVDIHSQGLELNDETRRRVERRLQFALARFEPRLLRTEVYVSDQNGPRGGVDKRCRILVRLRPHVSVIVERDDADLNAAIDGAAHRVAQALVRQLERRRAGRHHPEIH
jgi:putative sigma-54 modulation protein